MVNKMAVSFEGEPGPSSTEKTLRHAYPKTRFRRKRAPVKI